MGCMQSADFASQPRAQPKQKKVIKKKKPKATQLHEADEAPQHSITAKAQQPDVAARGEQPINPLTPPKAPSQSGQSATGSRSGKKPPPHVKPSASTRAESAVGLIGATNANAANVPDSSQLGSKKNGIARMLRSNEGGLNATKLGSVRMWIDTGDHQDLVDPQDVFGHERKMRRKLVKDFNSGGGDGSSYHDNNGLSNTNMTGTQYSMASRY